MIPNKNKKKQKNTYSNQSYYFTNIYKSHLNTNNLINLTNAKLIGKQ